MICFMLSAHQAVYDGQIGPLLTPVDDLDLKPYVKRALKEADLTRAYQVLKRLQNGQGPLRKRIKGFGDQSIEYLVDWLEDYGLGLNLHLSDDLIEVLNLLDQGEVEEARKRYFEIAEYTRQELERANEMATALFLVAGMQGVDALSLEEDEEGEEE